MVTLIKYVKQGEKIEDLENLKLQNTILNDTILVDFCRTNTREQESRGPSADE